MWISTYIFHTLSTKFPELCTFYLLKIIIAACYTFLTSKHGTDLFQIIQSVKIAFIQNASEFQDVSVKEFQFDEN